MNEKKCSVKDCTSKVRSSNLCNKHYHRDSYNKNIDKRRTYDKSPKRRFNKFVAHAKRMGIPTDITYEEWLSIVIDKKCHYCFGELPTHGYSLDRKYSNIGYFIDNVVPCCKDCNFTKRNLYSHIEFEVMMKALNEFRTQFQKK